MTKAKIYYHDIGDYLSREEKLSIVKKFGSIVNVPMQELTPNEHGDWISMRNDAFDTFIPMAPEKKFDLKTQAYFNTYSIGVNTGRDAWTNNYSSNSLKSNIIRMIDFYNNQIESLKTSDKHILDSDSTKISWTVNLKKDAEKLKLHSFNASTVKISSYRPFNKQFLYFDRPLIERPGINAQFYPNSNLKNVTICVSPSPNDGLSLLISQDIANLHFNGDTQCFPLYFYEENNQNQKGLFDEGAESEYIRRDGVSDFILERAKKQYNTNGISKEDIFYYVYGFLHSPEYRETFANDLKKMLPRLPLVDDVKDFWSFSNAGRKLAELHLNYETVAPFSGVIVSPFGGGSKGEDKSLFRVEKMRFPTGKKAKDCPDTIIYNSKITISSIPAEAYEYVVNGKSAIEWIMERYAITTHKDSGITNDPNDWADEVGNPRYILDLLLSIINVSVQTVGVVKGLPRVRFE